MSESVRTRLMDILKKVPEADQPTMINAFILAVLDTDYPLSVWPNCYTCVDTERDAGHQWISLLRAAIEAYELPAKTDKRKL